MKYTKVKKKIWIWSLVLCMCMILFGQSSSVFAESQENEYIENTGTKAYTVEEVKAMIDALPSVSEMEDMGEEELNSVYEQAQNAYDAFEALTDEEQDELAEELEKLREVLEFYTTLVEPTGDLVYVWSVAISWAIKEADSRTKIELGAKHWAQYDLNKGAGSRSGYMYLGWNETSDPNDAITDMFVLVRDDDEPPSTYVKNGITYYLHGSTAYNWTTNWAYGEVLDLNKGCGGKYLYLYITKDRNAGSPYTALMTVTGVGENNMKKSVKLSDGTFNVNPEGTARYIGYRTYWFETDSARSMKINYISAKGTAGYYHFSTANVDWPDSEWYPSIASANMPTSVDYNGYTFQHTGWRTTESSTDFSPQRTTAYLASTDRTDQRLGLGAVYESKVSVTYNINGGNGQPASQSLTVYAGISPTNGYDNKGTISTSGDARFTITSTTPTKNGTCKFLGWSTDKNATTAQYKAGYSYAFKQDTTLYAVYQTDHTYSTTWSTDTNYHWHAATCGHDLTADKASHTWSGGKCTVCKYVCQHGGLTTGYCTICGSCLSNGEVLTAPKQENSIYLIYTSKELAWFSAYVNGKDASIKGKLMADIDMSSTAWNPIGNSESTPYTGTFDGNGKKVTLKLSSSAEYLAMFSYVNGATIQNLTVDGTIDASYHFAASIIGRVIGGTVTLKNCLSVVTINSSYDRDGTHGGLVSITASGTLNIENCGFAGKIIGTQTTSCGGMVGWTDKSAKTNISNSYVAAEFDLKDNSGNTFGRNPNYVSVTNCYYLNALSDPSIATMMSEEQFKSGEVTWLLNSESASGVWKQSIDTDDYPNFSGQTVYYGYSDCTDRIYTNDSKKTEKGTHPEFDSKGFCVKCDGYQPAVWNNSAEYYEISNAGQLFWFAELVNKEKQNANGVLKTDIDLENRSWTPIGLYSDDSAISKNNKQYTGTFDGQYHVIYNLNVEMTENYEAGLFSRVATNGVVKNFGVINASVIQMQDGHESKGVRAGIIAGEIYRATVENVFSAGSLTLNTSHDQYGGLAGECKESNLKSCYTTMERLTDGTSGNTPTSVTLCYYQADAKNSASAGENMTAAQFASGEVTYTLNSGVTDGTQVWYQTIDTDTYPMFLGDTVYYYNEKYSNIEKITSVDIAWTDMKFSYSMGMWDAENEIWNEGNWIADEGCGTVTVKNTGTVEVTAVFGIEITDNSYGISASFMENDIPLEDGKLKLDVDGEKTVAVNLTGSVTPSDYIEEGINIGKITVQVDSE